MRRARLPGSDSAPIPPDPDPAVILLAQLAAAELHRAARLGWIDPAAADGATSASVAELAQAASLACDLQRRTAWVGGVTNHEDAFVVLFRRALLLWAVGPALSPAGRRYAAAALATTAEKLVRACCRLIHPSPWCCPCRPGQPLILQFATFPCRGPSRFIGSSSGSSRPPKQRSEKAWEARETAQLLTITQRQRRLRQKS